MGAQLGGGDGRGGRVGDDVGDEFGVAARRLAVAQHGHRLLHGAVRAQTVLDLAEFDPVAADLHLAVPASGDPQIAVGQPQRPVAGAVHPLAGSVDEGVGQEQLGRQRGLVAEADGQALAAGVQVALDADRAGAEVFVEHIVPGVVDRLAVGDAAPARVDGGDPVDVRPDGGLGGPAHGDGLGVRERLADRSGQRQRDEVTGQRDDPQVRGGGVAGVGGEQRGELVQGGGRRVPDGDRLGEQDVEEQFRVALLGLVGEVDARAAAEQAEHVEDGQVEAERGDGESEVGRAQCEGATAEVQQVAHRAVGDLDALGGAGGAGGEDDVGGVVPGTAGLGIVLGGGRPGDHRVGVGLDGGDPVGQRYGGGVGGGQHGGGAGESEHRGDPGAGQRGVDRQVAGAGLEDAVEGGDHLGSAPDPHADQFSGSCTGGDQSVGDPVGAAVEFAVGHGAAAPAQGHRLGGVRGLPLEQQVHGAVVGHRDGGLVPGVQHGVPFLRREPAGGGAGPGGVVGEQPQVVLEGGEHPLGEGGRQAGEDDVPAVAQFVALGDGDAVQDAAGGASEPFALADAGRQRPVGEVDEGGVDHGVGGLAAAEYLAAHLGEAAEAALGEVGVEDAAVLGGGRGEREPGGRGGDPGHEGVLARAGGPGGVRPEHHGQRVGQFGVAGDGAGERGEQQVVGVQAVLGGAAGQSAVAVDAAGQAGAAAAVAGGVAGRAEFRSCGESGEPLAPVAGLLGDGPRGHRVGPGRYRPGGRVGVQPPQVAEEEVDAQTVGHQQVEGAVHDREPAVVAGHP
ncbi:hypothetical protein RKD32_005953 [Streptomyces sp. SAI-195]